MRKQGIMKDIPESGIILYHTADGASDIRLYSRDGKVWLNQKQIAELFATSVANISIHASKILKDNELKRDSVVKSYLTTAADGKDYPVDYCSLGMILAIGFKVRGVRGVQFRQWWSIFLFFRKILSTSNWQIFRVSKGGAFSLLEKFSVRNWNFILPQKRV